MIFSEKLVFLMNLTSTTNKQLADVMSVDPSLVSLMRRGRREPPKKSAHTRSIASYFSKKCTGNYQRLALSEAMGGAGLQMQTDPDRLASVLFSWLTDNSDQAGQFLNTFERLPVKDAGSPPAPAEADASSYVYYGNEGRRGGVSAFIAQLLSREAKGTILYLTDESFDWLFEAPAYLFRLREQIALLLQRGYRICRIAPTPLSADVAFDSLSRWLPLYATGLVDAFYYPRLRDDLYRRTLLVLPGVAALFSNSVLGQPVSRMTVLTQNRRAADSLAGEFQDILARCRPSLAACPPAAPGDGLLRRILAFETAEGARIQQSAALSAVTSPPALIRLAAAEAGGMDAASLTGALDAAQTLFSQSLAQYETVDIHCLSTPEEVRSGTVPVSVSHLWPAPPLCYTPETYVLHLEQILDWARRYENYHPVILPRGAGAHTLMVKEGCPPLLLRPGSPPALFELTQPGAGQACREYLLRRGDLALPPAALRQAALSKIQGVIDALRRG